MSDIERSHPPSSSLPAHPRTAVTTVRDSGELLAMIPYVLGFTPEDSLVVAALLGPRKRLGPCLRADLPTTADEAVTQARYLLSVIGSHGFDPVILVAFTADPEAAEAVMVPLGAGLARRHVTVIEALRADGARWWSYTCSEAACCRPEGVAYDPDSSRIAAEAVLSGLQRAPTRESLRAQFDPVGVSAQRAVAMECSRLRRGSSTGGQARLVVADVDRLVVQHLPAPDAMSVPDTALLLLAVQEVALRDAAWALMSRSNAAEHFALWRRLMRTAPDHLMAPAGALTGFAAWLDGHGVLAWHALDRLQAVAPDYSMGLLLKQILEENVNPEVWSRFPIRRQPSG